MLLATNGDLMISNGAKDTGMGGVGIAVSHGSESLYSNPAMIKDVNKSEFSGYVTSFKPKVKFASDVGSDTMGNTPVPGYASSSANKSYIPGFAYVHRNNENIVWGVSVAGTAGMGTNYKKASPRAGTFNMQTQLEIAKMSIPVAYTSGDVTVAVAPVLQYSTLGINYATPAGASNNKKASSVGLGMTAGVAYKNENLTVGAVYKSKIEASYKNNISTATRDFGMKSITSGDSLDQPAEMGVGVAYKMGNNTVAADFKRIEWAKAKGYKDFGWKNQNIVAVGYQYATPDFALRAGYNHGKSPVQELDGTATANGSNYVNAGTNFFNLSGFPGVVEEHYTIGADYAFTKDLGVSLGFVYSPEVTDSYDTTAMSAGMAYNGAIQQGAGQAQAGAAAQAASSGSTANVKHSQQALTVGANYTF